jgi:hypothetical protein
MWRGLPQRRSGWLVLLNSTALSSQYGISQPTQDARYHGVTSLAGALGDNPPGLATASVVHSPAPQ